MNSNNYVDTLEFKFGLINYCYNPRPYFDPPDLIKATTQSPNLPRRTRVTLSESTTKPQSDVTEIMLVGSRKNRERFAIKKSYSIEVSY